MKRNLARFNITGNLYGIRGDLSGITGNLSGIKGDLFDITGDLTGITGNLTGVIGDVDSCEITDEERAAGIHISELTEREKSCLSL